MRERERDREIERERKSTQLEDEIKGSADWFLDSLENVGEECASFWLVRSRSWAEAVYRWTMVDPQTGNPAFFFLFFFVVVVVVGWMDAVS